MFDGYSFLRREPIRVQSRQYSRSREIAGKDPVQHVIGLHAGPSAIKLPAPVVLDLWRAIRSYTDMLAKLPKPLGHFCRHGIMHTTRKLEDRPGCDLRTDRQRDASRDNTSKNV
ncbi:uncharacterized protein MYCFIDRAFT_216230 [Pseudocercospora fijiensis CIRAD86]|uniref:Uncharacterized protein n=1 Tax=Pseudocercospora fijiensis (strain CIRAD86) TaxID=383855 RepID=M3ATG3_PSEFD|nr:uncharacterized protein MYCFIDRAFT_216230 [Pseudocercospora fijiensis CIRAD86]EME80443.1 hypothetical protein MYCFIDRAFT_216230 [Pseudocercospora fijiensis CIRAD86]